MIYLIGKPVAGILRLADPLAANHGHRERGSAERNPRRDDVNRHGRAGE